MTLSTIYITKQNGERQLFDVTKLDASLERAGVASDERTTIIETVTPQMHDGMSTAEIYRLAFKELHGRARPAALGRYSLRRAVAELGPSGFAFEKFVAAIFIERGYSTCTDQHLQGHCVMHELDVVAWKDKELILVEAKFHNEYVVKSDLKVALYVKARFEDLQNQTFSYGGERKMTDGLLITNTKFTTEAVKYAACAGVRLIGWNYPHRDNLHDMIIETNLHPITSLTTLTHEEKQACLRAGVVLCREIAAISDLFRANGSSPEHVEEVMTEIDRLCGRSVNSHV